MESYVHVLLDGYQRHKKQLDAISLPFLAKPSLNSLQMHVPIAWKVDSAVIPHLDYATEIPKLFATRSPTPTEDF